MEALPWLKKHLHHCNKYRHCHKHNINDTVFLDLVHATSIWKMQLTWLRTVHSGD